MKAHSAICFVGIAMAIIPIHRAKRLVATHLKMSIGAAPSVNVLISGLPGLMALETAKSCLDHGLNVLSFGFTGNTKQKSCKVEGKTSNVNVELIRGPGIEGNNASDFLLKLKSQFPHLIAIDYTHPSAVINNIKCYVNAQCDFVMGTTGGDPKSVLDAFLPGRNIAVVAPNMAKQIVATQATLLDMSLKYPKAFKDYKLKVVESHQSSKADTSGTAKALVAYISELTGEQFSFENILKIRDREGQLKFGVPEGSLSGHAFHTYTLTSADGSVVFELKHNVCGRRVYADGTVSAVRFLHALRSNEWLHELVSQQESTSGIKKDEQVYLLDGTGAKTNRRRLFNMIDVLQSEALL